MRWIFGKPARLLPVIGLLLLMVGAVGLQANQSASALWPFSRYKKPEVVLPGQEVPGKYQPPPVEQMAEECEPIKERIVETNTSGKLTRIGTKPLRARLKVKYRRCQDDYRTQEYNYLKHAVIDVKAPPPKETLPALNPEGADTGSGGPSSGKDFNTLFSKQAPSAPMPQQDVGIGPTLKALPPDPTSKPLQGNTDEDAQPAEATLHPKALVDPVETLPSNPVGEVAPLEGDAADLRTFPESVEGVPVE